MPAARPPIQELPGSDRQRRRRDWPALGDDGAERPAEAGEQGERKPRRELARADQRQAEAEQSGDAQAEAEQPRAIKTLAQRRPGHQRRPDRHGEGQDRGPRGRRHQLREGEQDVEGGDREDAGDDEPRPVRVRHVEADAAPQRDRDQSEPGEAHAAGAERPGRDLGQRDPHRRPVQAPEQAEQRDEQERAGGGVRHEWTMREERLAPSCHFDGGSMHTRCASNLSHSSIASTPHHSATKSAMVPVMRFSEARLTRSSKAWMFCEIGP